MSWWNPKNWLQLYSMFKTIWTSGKAAYLWIKKLLVTKAQKNEVEKAADAVRELEEANKIEDENERIRKKSEAACKLEKSLNPDADC